MMSIISLICIKDDGNKDKNYRPISLTNCDHKILAFVLDKRFYTFIPKLINND